MRPRAEYIVPAICLLVLALALAWNAFAPDPDENPTVNSEGTVIAETADPLLTPGVAGLGQTPTLGPAGGGEVYPGVATPTLVTDGPTGVEVVPTFDPQLPPIDGTATFDEGLATPTTPAFDSTPVNPGDGTGYPPPGTNPTGEDSGGGQFPTEDPFAFPTQDPNVPTPDFGQFPTDPPVVYPTEEPFVFPTDPPASGDDGNQVYPPPTDVFPTEDPINQFPTEDPFNPVPTDEPFPGEETPVDPNDPVPTDDPSLPTDPNATPEAPVDATPTTQVPPTPTLAPPTPTPPPPPTATPTPDPVVLITGNVRWPAQGPITLSQSHLVAAGSSLTIDPGVEVRLMPGVKLFVEGTLRAAGVAGAPVRFVGPQGRWTAIIGQPGSTMSLDFTEIRSAGRSGVAVSSTRGTLTMRNSLITEGGGGILADDAVVDIRNSTVTGNDLPTSQPLFVRMGAGKPVTLQGNIFGGNQLPQGTSNVRIAVTNAGGGPLDVQGNTFVGASGPSLDLQTDAAVGGAIRCNVFRGGTIGLQLNSSTPSGEGFSLAVDTNAFEGQTTYGVASTIGINAPNNWWGDPSGPGDAQRNPQGKGVRVGVNVGFAPQLQARPACAPAP